jgi:2-oxo-4-hydroxy-4-carboxy--5-ureidoimidazoline (OHCU) decarboxylase
MTPEQPERDEQVLKKLSKLFAESPETTEAAADELSAYGVDVERLSRRIRDVIESAAEKERLAWLEEYARYRAGAKGRVRRPEIPQTRSERLRMLDELQKRAAERGLPAAVGFKKLKLEALSDQDLGRIIEALLDTEETE